MESSTLARHGKDLLKSTSEPVIKMRVKTQRPVMDAFMATQRSDSACNFGTSLREKDRPSDVPGPGTYNVRAITGVKGFESKIRSTPHFSLRGREKFGDPVPGGRGTELEPGPGHYRPRTLGLAGDFPPEFSFPKAVPPRDTKKMAPGPGEYKSIPAVGKQVLSTKKNHAPVGFGAGERPPLILISTGDVGPGEYTQGPAACNNQVDSRKKSSGRVTFGTGGRHKAAVGERNLGDTAEMPAPGQYSLKSCISGDKCGPGYTYKCPPRISMSGRNKFGSPFAKW